jgi:aspartate racemase
VWTIGLIAGMSWESPIPYYRQINETIKERLGGLHSAKIASQSWFAYVSRNGAVPG